jgi:SAM-dependent methyltransferase
MIAKHVREVHSYLDLGCSDGGLTTLIARIVNADRVFGIDVDSNALAEASRKGVRSFLCNIDTDHFPFHDEEFDLITAFDVIEHLLNPDHMLREVGRCLRKSGFFPLSTPNAASWYNRALLLLGHPILGIDLSSEYGYRYPLGVTSVISGRRRLYTLKALKGLLSFHGFEAISSKGCSSVVEDETYRAFEANLPLRHGVGQEGVACRQSLSARQEGCVKA